MAITLKEVAKKAGVSVTTASRALSGYDDVAEMTRRRIQMAADQLGYSPNLMARRLKTRRTETLGLIIPSAKPDFSDPFITSFLSGVGDEAAKNKYDLLISTHAPDSRGEKDAYARAVAGGWVDGVIVLKTRRSDWRIQYLHDSELPFVTFGRSNFDFTYPYIDEDSLSSIRLITEHLINLKHRSIAFIAPPNELMFSLLRREGYINTMRQHDLSVRPEWVIEGDLTQRGGYEAMNTLFALKKRPTAVIAGNDLMAIGAMDAVKDRGLKIGRDISIGSFDDIPIAAYTDPPLTTVRQSVFDVGRMTCEMLIHLVEEKEPYSTSILLKPDLVLRKSTGPVPVY